MPYLQTAPPPRTPSHRTTSLRSIGRLQGPLPARYSLAKVKQNSPQTVQQRVPLHCL